MQVIPIISAVHPCGIYCAITTKNYKWLFTGGQDGFIRKYDLYQSLNGESMLTGVQKHGLVDTIYRGGMLVSAWENDERVLPTDEEKSSPVYSIDVQSEGIWLVTGTQSGSIHLYTVRHQEGKLIHSLKGHKGIVSCLKITPDERHLLSGGIDKSIKLWSLDTGAMVKEFTVTSQVMQLLFHPLNTNMFLACTLDGCVYVYNLKEGKVVSKITSQVSESPPWALSACWSLDGQKIYIGRSASQDNIRLWDTEYVPEPTGPQSNKAGELLQDTQKGDFFEDMNNDPIFDFSLPKPKKMDLTDYESTNPLVPFTIVPGHHGGLVSQILLNDQFMVSVSGSRWDEYQATNMCIVYDIKHTPISQVPVAE